MVTLLQILPSEEVDIAIRQAASIYLKNSCRRKWDATEETLLNADKETMRENIVEVLIRVPPKIR